jgi:hypothetical protein
MANGPYAGRWTVNEIRQAILDGTFVPLQVSYSPAPAGTPFTDGIWEGVDFTSSATVTIVGSGEMEYTVVAGGGGGDQATSQYFAGGGGGGGGVRSSAQENQSGGPTPTGLIADAEPRLKVGSGTYAVTIGAGGVGSSSFPAGGCSGSPSAFGPIVSIGGGGGLRSDVNSGQPGGSGGSSNAGTPGQGTVRQGYPSGVAGANAGGGGGGATASGSPGNPLGGGDGGAGRTFTYVPTGPFAVGGGGGGGSTPYYGRTAGGAGGSGGAGTGGSDTTPNTSGTANTGGGAGGSATVNSGTQAASNGGSGRVIIRWRTV